MTKKIYWLIGSLVGIALLAFAIRTAGADEFYKGKTIRFVVGLAAGGGYDLSARTVGRHMGKHIPGNPTIVVENMTGAGSLIAANYTYNSAKPDGLFVGIWNSAYVLRQALGDKAMQVRCPQARLDRRSDQRNALLQHHGPHRIEITEGRCCRQPRAQNGFHRTRAPPTTTSLRY